MVFKNRQHAGKLLARRLLKIGLDPKRSTVVAIPRGGVVVGQVVSKRLGIPLDVVVIKKLGAPQNPELAIGATASFGKPILDRWLIAELGVSGDYLKKEIIKKKREARQREKLLGVESFPGRFKGKTVIVCDDGLATGQTAKAAGKVVRELGATFTVLAVPCASPTTLENVKADFNEVLCLEIDAELSAVGQYYQDFSQVTDEQVKVIITSQRK